MRSPLGFLFAVALFGSDVQAAPCQEPKLGEVSDVDPECFFYKGTRLFRSKDYAAASVQWQALVDLKDIPKEAAGIQIRANNNLGFLYYMGWGVGKDRLRAIQYWIPAEKLGHMEAGYHLCHAYAETNPPLALAYCRKALRRYGKLDMTDDETAKIVSQLKTHIAALKKK